jgi:predicted nucleotidyltransferase
MSDMPSTLTDAQLDSLSALARRTANLDVMVVFGSRARGEAHPGSDWDIGYLSSGAIDVGSLLGEIAEIAGTDRLDLVDLDRASGLLRFRAARDGRLVFERSVGRFDRFRLEAALFWCDAAPVLARAYEDVLGELGS